MSKSITPAEKELGFRQHQHLKRQILSLFPKLRPGQHTYIQNKISQILRKAKCDIIQIWIDNKPFRSCQYESSYFFTVGRNTTVYMNIQVD